MTKNSIARMTEFGVGENVGLGKEIVSNLDLACHELHVP
jgi:hypothetical protein